jgi:hypothetical protein
MNMARRIRERRLTAQRAVLHYKGFREVGTLNPEQKRSYHSPKKTISSSG